MSKWLSIIGMGKDGYEGLSAHAKALIADAVVIIGSRRLLGRSFQATGLVGNANQKHRLLGVLQQIDNPVLAFFEVDRLSIRK